MKKILFSVLIALLCAAPSYAQYAGTSYSDGTSVTNTYQKKKYKELKKLYNAKRYHKQSGQPYSPGLSGVASFLIPGLGQVFDGEIGRGILVWLGQEAIGIGTYATLIPYYMDCVDWLEAQGVDLQSEEEIDISTLDMSTMPKVPTSFWAMLAGGVVYYIWNIKDARKIAKVKNMYWQDCNGLLSTIDMGFEPYFAYTPAAAPGMISGLSLKVNF